MQLVMKHVPGCSAADVDEMIKAIDRQDHKPGYDHKCSQKKKTQSPTNTKNPQERGRSDQFLRVSRHDGWLPPCDQPAQEDSKYNKTEVDVNCTRQNRWVLVVPLEGDHPCMPTSYAQRFPILSIPCHPTTCSLLRRQNSFQHVTFWFWL